MPFAIAVMAVFVIIAGVEMVVLFSTEPVLVKNAKMRG